MMQKHSPIPSVLVCAIAFVYVIVLSFNALWLGDDITYQFSFSTGGRIESLKDVLTSQIAHYYKCNGRFVAHFLVQAVLVLGGKTMFALLNSAAFVLLSCLVCTYCGLDLKNWKAFGLVTVLLLFGLQTKFVPTCQIGYVWMFCLVLGFVLLFRLAGGALSSWNLLWLAPFSLVAGWSQEALVIGIAAALAIEVLTRWKTISAMQWVMLCFFAAGSMLLCFSPASLGRTGESHASTDLMSSAMLSFAKFFYYLRATYLLLAVVLVRAIKEKSLKAVYSTDPFLWHAWIVLIMFNLVVGVFGNRQLFGVELISVILIVKLLPEGWVRNAITVTLAVSMVAVGCHKYSVLRHRASIFDEVVAQACISDDGRSYYDLSSSDVIFRDEDPCDPFSWYVKSTIERLLISDGRFSDGQHFDILPSVCKTLGDSQVINSAEGSLVFVLKTDDMPCYVEVGRELRLLGMKCALPPFRADLSSPVYCDGEFAVYQVFDKIPFVHNVTAWSE